MNVAYLYQRLGIVIEDIYFVEPNPDPGEEGPERGVRVEVRHVENQPKSGSRYSAYPIDIRTAIWRADLLGSVAAGPGARDRMHYHPGMVDDEPGDRQYAPAITADPLAWLTSQIEQIEQIVAAKVPDVTEYDSDLREIRRQVPVIVASVAQMMEQVRRGELAKEPA
ncbi:hypothetical protein B1R94_17405 [Mycolicibacterium litorale]|nr:hypothetical protein B1R94_17405 [Mycolicibacterium litorale]